MMLKFAKAGAGSAFEACSVADVDASATVGGDARGFEARHGFRNSCTPHP
jgi:hypothetical protein